MKLIEKHYQLGVTCCYGGKFKSLVMLVPSDEIVIAYSEPKHDYGPGAKVVVLCKRFLWIKRYYIVGYFNKNKDLLDKIK